MKQYKKDVLYCYKTLKVKFTKKEAKTSLNANKNKRGKDGASRIYLCEYCKKYHLTSKEKLESEDFIEIELINKDKFKNIINNALDIKTNLDH